MSFCFTSGTCQINDVGLHKPFKATYLACLDIESKQFLERELADGSIAGPTRRPLGRATLTFRAHGH